MRFKIWNMYSFSMIQYGPLLILKTKIIQNSFLFKYTYLCSIKVLNLRRHFFVT